MYWKVEHKKVHLGMFHCNVLLADSTLYLSLFDSCLFILIECHKIKSKATTTANQKRENHRQKSQ